MPTDTRDRFLIALAKFFGESPTRNKPLASLQLSSQKLMDEILALLFHDDELSLTVEQFNRLMVCCQHRLATEHFFTYFFQNVKTIDEFEKAVDKYRVKAMWLYANFRFAYRRLATCDEQEFNEIIRETETVREDAFSSREPFNEIETIPVSDLHLLGYIAKAHLDNLEFTHSTVQELTRSGVDRSKVLGGVGPSRLQRIVNVIKNYGIILPDENLAKLGDVDLQKLARQVADLVEPLRAARNKAISIGERNTERYLTMPHLDVYVATSMREKADFIAQNDFTTRVFSDPQVEPLRLRYFDPTLSYVENRITKGLIEMLMLRRAAVTIYVAGTSDTLGKDSELAATLAQGKPVIVYVPPGTTYDRRAETFQADHPLGLQIAVATGVAHGIMVVRSPEQCGKVLRKVMLRERSFTIEHEKGLFLLRETESKSVVRVVSDNPLLTHAFWTYFNKT